jgi:hypothetical protein
VSEWVRLDPQRAGKMLCFNIVMTIAFRFI